MDETVTERHEDDTALQSAARNALFELENMTTAEFQTGRDLVARRALRKELERLDHIREHDRAHAAKMEQAGRDEQARHLGESWYGDEMHEQRDEVPDWFGGPGDAEIMGRPNTEEDLGQC